MQDELFLEANIAQQQMFVYSQGKIVRTYAISTGANGAGEQNGSGKTPRGLHIIRAKIGQNAPVNTVFVGRRSTGEIYSPKLQETFPERDWILTRILWLSGIEPGKNRLRNVDTMQRYIYIHGTPDNTILGKPGSKGCIRMRNSDIIELFDWVPYKTRLLIKES